MNKLIISYIVAFLILGAGVMGFKKLGAKKTKAVEPIKKEIPGVRVVQVSNEVKPIHLKSNGSLVAKNKIDLFAEVQGIFENSDRLYKPGVYYKKDDVLLQINSEEYSSNLQIQKSKLYQSLVGVLPDLRLDYPQQFDKWQRYISAFDINTRVKALPTFDTQQEKLFITGRGIPTAYYLVKNQQERLAKYTIRAPYSGILTQAFVNKGTLVNPGQRLGTFIDPTVYELEVSISPSIAKYVKTGKQIQLQSLDNTRQWSGKVSRINPVVDPQSQSMTVYIRVTGKGLQEGQYLQTNIETTNDKPVVEINRSLLVDNKYVYAVERDSVLTTKNVSVVYLGEKTALIEGLEDGSIILDQALPGAYDGKIVKVIKK